MKSIADQRSDLCRCMMLKFDFSHFPTGFKLREIFAADDNPNGMWQGTTFEGDCDSVVDLNGLSDEMPARADHYRNPFCDYSSAGFVENFSVDLMGVI